MLLCIIASDWNWRILTAYNICLWSWVWNNRFVELPSCTDRFDRRLRELWRADVLLGIQKDLYNYRSMTPLPDFQQSNGKLMLLKKNSASFLPHFVWIYNTFKLLYPIIGQPCGWTMEYWGKLQQLLLTDSCFPSPCVEWPLGTFCGALHRCP